MSVAGIMIFTNSFCDMEKPVGEIEKNTFDNISSIIGSSWETRLIFIIKIITALALNQLAYSLMYNVFITRLFFDGVISAWFFLKRDVDFAYSFMLYELYERQRVPLWALWRELGRQLPVAVYELRISLRHCLYYPGICLLTLVLGHVVAIGGGVLVFEPQLIPVFFEKVQEFLGYFLNPWLEYFYPASEGLQNIVPNVPGELTKEPALTFTEMLELDLKKETVVVVEEEDPLRQEKQEKRRSQMIIPLVFGYL